jgi:hypothetical protein
MRRWFGIGTATVGNWFARHRPRGAVVPFEAPALRMARVCHDERDGLIAILRDFANNGTAYIVPWSSLPLVMAMTEHDKALHEAVGEARACTPAEIRAVVSRLSLSGAMGPEAKARASENARAERTRRADIELILILHLLDSCGADLATFAADPGRWPAQQAKSAAKAAARATGVKRRDIYRRVGEFTALVTPIGLVSTQGAVQSGWLRVLHDEIEAFGRRTVSAAQSAGPGLDAHLVAIAEAARRTAQLSGIVLEMLDYAVLDISGTIRRWNSELPVLRKAIERLDLLLDEWPCLMQMTREALREPAGKAVAQLGTLQAMLPRAPEVKPPSGGPASRDNAATPSVSAVLRKKVSAIRSLLSASHRVGRQQPAEADRQLD